MSIDRTGGSYKKENLGEGLVDKISIKRQELLRQGGINFNKFYEIIKEVSDSQSTIIDAVLGEHNQSDIKGDYHEIEIDLTQKNKNIIIPILEQIGILYTYQNENNQKKIIDGIDILSPDNKETDNYTLSIIIKRRNIDSPFYIELIDIKN